MYTAPSTSDRDPALSELDHLEGPRETPESSFRDLCRSTMRPAVRLTKLPGGGFRVDGVLATPLDAVPDGDGFMVGGAGSWRLTWKVTERGWLLRRLSGDSTNEGEATTSSALPHGSAPISVMLEDGRLFRLAPVGLSELCVELGRWDVPGAYALSRPVAGGWDLERTAAGAALDAPPELWILTCAELGRLDGWY